MPALGGGIHEALGCSRSLGNAPTPQQASAIVKHCGLPERYAIFRLVEANPVSVPDGRHGWSERTYLHGHVPLALAEPVPVVNAHGIDRECTPRPHYYPRGLPLDANDVQGFLLTADLDPPSLAHSEMDHALVPTKHPPIEINYVARRLRLRAQALHQPGIITVGHEADVLAVGLGRDLEIELGRNPAHLVLGQVAERKAQEVELITRGAVEEVALV